MTRYTLSEIAKLLGVSTATISRVANNCANVKPETRERVLKAMKKYHYVPNQIARNLKLRCSNVVGVIIPDIAEPFFANVVKGMEAVLSSAGYIMFLGVSNEDERIEINIIEYMMQHQIDGIVLATVANQCESHLRYVNSGLPIMFIDNLPKLSVQYCAVITDNDLASRQAVDHLYGLGHKRIALIAGKQSETTGAARLKGYRSAMEDNGLAIDPGWIRIGDFKGESGYRHMTALLRENPEITAVYVNSAQMTYGAYKAILDASLRIPEDISIVGFDIQNNTGLLESNITSIVQQDTELGRIACETLINMIEAKGATVMRKILLDSTLIVRQSTGSCKS